MTERQPPTEPRAARTAKPSRPRSAAGGDHDPRSAAERTADHAAIDRLADELLPALVAKLSATGLGESIRTLVSGLDDDCTLLFLYRVHDECNEDIRDYETITTQTTLPQLQDYVASRARWLSPAVDITNWFLRISRSVNSSPRSNARAHDRVFVNEIGCSGAMACGVHKFDPLTLHACTRGINRPIDRAAERRPRSVPSISRSDERSITLRAGRS